MAAFRIRQELEIPLLRSDDHFERCEADPLMRQGKFVRTAKEPVVGPDSSIRLTAGILSYSSFTYRSRYSE